MFPTVVRQSATDLRKSKNVNHHQEIFFPESLLIQCQQNESSLQEVIQTLFSKLQERSKQDHTLKNRKYSNWLTREIFQVLIKQELIKHAFFFNQKQGRQNSNMGS